MKTNLFVLFLVLITAVGLFYPSKPEKQIAPSYWTFPGADKFLVGAMDNGFNTSYNRIDESQMSLWCKYTVTVDGASRKEPHGWTTNDGLNNVIGDYENEVKALLDDMEEHNMRCLMMRPKIEWLCYGQRSDYQCEVDVPDERWFYAFNDHPTGQEYSEQNGTIKGRFCRIENSTTSGSTWHSAGYVVKNLKANTEQCQRGTGSNAWQEDTQSDWLIKPRIRIDSMFANNSSNLNTLVCRVDIKNQENNLIKSIDIKVRNFKPNLQTRYNGNYIDEYYFVTPDWTDTSSQIRTGDWGDTWLWNSRGNTTNSGADIQVYWYGSCDMWLDYVRVDNDVAHRLLKPGGDEQFELWLEWEADNIGKYSPNGHHVPYKFYIELFQFNNIPCMKYVNDKLKIHSDGMADLIADFSWVYYSAHLPWDNAKEMMWSSTEELDASTVVRDYIDEVGITRFMMETYPLTGPDPPPDTYFKIPNTLPNLSSPVLLATTTGPAAYDEWLQEHFDKSNYPDPPVTYIRNTWHDPGYFRWNLELADGISKLADIPWINMPQVHQWWKPEGEVRREPTNEELDMMANVAISYGTRGFIYFTYTGFGTEENTQNNYYGKGLCKDYSNSIRDTNYYGQLKWQKFKNIVDRVSNLWGSVLMSFDDDNRHSYIYRIGSERTDLIANTYFADVVSYEYGTGSPICNEDNPGGTAPAGMRFECKVNRYLQVATFKKSTNDGNKYFMIVNRRCSPLQQDHNDGERYVRVIFQQNHTEFAGYRNWNIIDVENPKVIVDTFDKTAANVLVDLGLFKPGQGRLYKIVPVVRSGGTLIADEDVSGQSFTCEDTVLNGGYNITIDSGTTISFTDSATIIMTNATFTAGSPTAPTSQLNTFKGVGSGKWKGLRFNDATVKIYNSKFQDIASPTGGCYAVSSIDCPLNDIRNNTFISSTDTAGGVNILYVDISSMSINSYVMYNTFTMNSSFARAVQVQGFGGLTAGVYVKANTMTSSGNATGVFLSTITGGVVKNNSISGFSTGVNTVLSSINLYGNTISNTSALSKGILGTSSSNISMVPSGSQWIGGFNSITNTSGNSKNIDVSSSIFYLDGGKNTFDVTSSGSAYHLYGSMWDDGGSHAEQENNCFKLGGTQLDAPSSPNNSVTDGTNPITFDFLDYTCNATPPSGTTIIDIGNGLYDTIPTSGGAGGGFSSKVNKVFTLTPKALYDSICVQMIHRNYNVVKALCYELIDDYPNSTEAVASLQTLFMASIKTDTSSGSVSALKTYYQNLILNNGSNAALVKISNYLIQKCKVLLRQYSSALSGFQQIINENQYNYEGLLARWDYMATSLLMQGQGGAFRGDNEEGDEREEGDDDKSPLTKEQKKAVRETISSINEKNRNYNEARVKTLEEKTKNGDADAEKELKVMKTLKDVVKLERPKDVFEHMRIVNNDIQKVFGSEVDNSPNSNNNNLPTVFRLSQNYPNPFNPVTKINYDLPKDSKVTLIIYDILGREVKRLVNNEIKPAGSYFIEFNAVNYASGVYFYRIEAEELNGSKHIDAKKMVLVK